MRLWRMAAQWSPADRGIVDVASRTVARRMSEACGADNGAVAVGLLVAAMDDAWPPGRLPQRARAQASLVLAAMRAIDDAFLASHPRSRTVAASLGAPPPTPAWVDDAWIRRLANGHFRSSDGFRLIPNGPFARHGRGRDAASADTLDGHFAALAVAPLACMHGDRRIEVRMKVVGTDVMRGVPSTGSVGRERIRFVPLAEDVADLAYAEGHRGDTATLDVRPATDLAARLLDALQACGDVDLAIAPELTVPCAAVPDVIAGIVALGEQAPRIILAGSGLSDDADDLGRHWNEARVIARGGALLWSHRKIWPFGMQRGSAIRYGFADPGDERMLMEDVAAGATVTVVDIDGFGRCIVLICQDFQTQPIVDELVARYQPDWVMTPVLDPGVNVPGWAHQRAVSLSQSAQSRFLVASSLSMTHLGGSPAKPEPPIGLAVGPYHRNVQSGQPGRALAIVMAVASTTPRSGVLVWDHASPAWQTTTVTSDGKAPR